MANIAVIIAGGSVPEAYILKRYNCSQRKRGDASAPPLFESGSFNGDVFALLNFLFVLLRDGNL